MEIITSISNERVKALRRLKEKREREASGEFLLEGVNLIKDLPQNIKVTAVYLSKSKAGELMPLAEKRSANVYVLADNVFASASDTETPQGIIASAEIPKSMPLSGRALVLDHISDMGNLGTILRTGASFGVRDAVLLGCADPYAGKAVRASMGGVFHMNIKRTEDLDCLAGYTVLALDMGGEDIGNYCVTDQKTALAVGSEAHGLSPAVLKRADKILSIPMKTMESLNAGIAAGIALYKLFNQLL